MENKSFLEAIATGRDLDASESMLAALNNRVADALEVRKVELASAILNYDEVVEEEVELVTEELSDAARELVLHADNNQHLHRSSHMPIIANLERKVKKGVYDHSRARDLWKYHADRSAHSYAKQHGDGRTPWHKMFSTSDRKQAAHHFANAAKEHLGLDENYFTAALAGHSMAASRKERKLPDHLVKLIKDKKLDKKPTHTIKDVTPKGYGPNEAVQGGAATTASSSRNMMANLRRATQVLGIKGVNPTIAVQAHKDFEKLSVRNPKAPGHMLLRKLSPNKAAAIQSLSQSGVPMGGALNTNPSDFNQTLQRIKRFK